MQRAGEDPFAVFTTFDRGLMAYQRKEFDTAREVLAQADGDGRAWQLLGQLTSEGSGGTQNPALAARYYERAGACQDR